MLNNAYSFPLHSCSSDWLRKTLFSLLLGGFVPWYSMYVNIASEDTSILYWKDGEYLK